MYKPQLEFLFNQFRTGTKFTGFREIDSGHINDTYLIETTSEKKYVLQRINHKVFLDVPGLVNNKVLVSKHLVNKLGNNESFKVLEFVPTSEGLFYFLDGEGNFWNLSIFIEDSRIYETVPNEKVAFEGGKLTGLFLNLTSDLKVSDFIEVIPKFHDMSFRYEQFEEALNKGNEKRFLVAEEEIRFCLERKEEMMTLQNLKEAGELPIRITHNDTKISNILFNQKEEGIAVIDTDTVMPGIIHYDFGDAIRTMCNSAAEDESDLSKVQFNMEFYKNYKRGFLEGLGTGLTKVEKEHLPTAVKTMIFIMGLRFLTDFLNGDVYYKVQFENHNLVRARNQFKLLSSFEQQL